MKKTVSKLLAVLLSVAVLALVFAGCTKEVEIQCTCDCCAGASGGESDGLQASANFTANGKSGVDTSKMPSSKEDILTLYNDVANATKSADTMKYQEINEGAKIAVKTLVFDKNGKELGSTMMSAVQSLIDNFSPKPITKNITVSGGKVTEETAERDGKEVDAEDVGATVESMLPARDQTEASLLTNEDVAEAAIEEDGDYWKVTLTLVDSEFSFTNSTDTPDTAAGRVMSTLQAGDLITNFGDSAAITSADLIYQAAKVVALIDPESGYLVALATYLDIYGHVTGQVDLLNIGGINGELDKTTYYVTYYWESIG